MSAVETNTVNSIQNLQNVEGVSAGVSGGAAAGALELHLGPVCFQVGLPVQLELLAPTPTPVPGPVAHAQLWYGGVGGYVCRFCR